MKFRLISAYVEGVGSGSNPSWTSITEKTTWNIQEQDSPIFLSSNYRKTKWNLRIKRENQPARARAQQKAYPRCCPRVSSAPAQPFPTFPSHGTHKANIKFCGTPKNMFSCPPDKKEFWIIPTGWILLCWPLSFFIWQCNGKEVSVPDWVVRYSMF